MSPAFPSAGTSPAFPSAGASPAFPSACSVFELSLLEGGFSVGRESLPAIVGWLLCFHCLQCLIR
jgi:hypothetical protein